MPAFIVQLLAITSNGASYTVLTFVGLVVLDDVLGVALSIRTRTFSFQKLPSFLGSQFGTRQAAALGGMVATAFLGQFAAVAILNVTSLKGLESLVLQLVQVVFTAATVGAGALALKVFGDLVTKLAALVGQPAPALFSGVSRK